MHPKIKLSRNHLVVERPTEDNIAHDEEEDDDNYDEDIVELDATDDVQFGVGGSSPRHEFNTSPRSNIQSELDEVDEFLDNSMYHKIFTQILKYLPGGDKKGPSITSF